MSSAWTAFALSRAAQRRGSRTITLRRLQRKLQTSYRASPAPRSHRIAGGECCVMATLSTDGDAAVAGRRRVGARLAMSPMPRSGSATVRVPCGHRELLRR
jgi:hypothetical protein